MPYPNTTARYADARTARRPARRDPEDRTPGRGPADRASGTDAGATAARRSRQLDALLRHSPAQPIFRVRAKYRLAVLAYRGIDDPAAFAAQMDRLLRLAVPVSLEDVRRAAADGTPLPPRSALVTFDHGDRTVLTEGLPVLASRGIPAAVFVVADLVGSDQPFWWREAEFLARHGGTARSLPYEAPEALVRRLTALPDPDRRRSLAELRVSASRQAPHHEQLSPRDLRSLCDGGLEIGNHTLGHPRLDRCDDSTVRTEIAEAHLALARWTGEEPTAFSYPNGAFDARASRVLAELGYRLGFLFGHRHEELLPGDPLRINRLRMDSSASVHRFDTVLSGLQPAVCRLRERS